MQVGVGGPDTGVAKPERDYGSRRLAAVTWRSCDAGVRVDPLSSQRGASLAAVVAWVRSARRPWVSRYATKPGSSHPASATRARVSDAAAGSRRGVAPVCSSDCSRPGWPPGEGFHVDLGVQAVVQPWGAAPGRSRPGRRPVGAARRPARAGAVRPHARKASSLAGLLHDIADQVRSIGPRELDRLRTDAGLAAGCAAAR